MHEHAVHFVGTGAVALAYGYLLTERGHKVFHTSLRGIQLPQIPVAIQTGEGTSRALYTPRYWRDAGPATVPQVNVFSVHGAQLALAVRQAGTLSPPACNLILCSDPDPVAEAWAQVSAESYVLVYPLLSAELCGERGLQVVTNQEVEICPRPARAIGECHGVVALIEDLGLTVTACVSPRRFRARHLQTAGVYVTLLAVSLGTIDAAKVDLALLRAVHEQLLAMATERDREFAVDLPAVDPGHYRLLAALMAAGERPGADSLLAHSLLYLVEDGRRKLIAHLAAIAPAWNEYVATRPLETAAQNLISSVLARCRPDTRAAVADETGRHQSHLSA